MPRSRFAYVYSYTTVWLYPLPIKVRACRVYPGVAYLNGFAVFDTTCPPNPQTVLLQSILNSSSHHPHISTSTSISGFFCCSRCLVFLRSLSLCSCNRAVLIFAQRFNSGSLASFAVHLKHYDIFPLSLMFYLLLYRQ